MSHIGTLGIYVARFRYCQIIIGVIQKIIIDIIQTKALHIDGLVFTLLALIDLLCPKYVTMDISAQKIKYILVNAIFLVYQTHLSYID